MEEKSHRSQTGLIVTLALCHFAAALLYYSWHRTQEVTLTAEGRKTLNYSEKNPEFAWRQIDESIFRNLNGTLRDSRTAQTFWAIANHRAFDLISSGLMGAVLWFGVLRNGCPLEKLAQIKVGLFLLVILLLVRGLLSSTVFDFYRSSASLVVTDEIIRLSKLEHVTWHLKDVAVASFPGDHGAVLLTGAVYISRFSNIWWGATGFLVAIFCTLPRVLAGAHWASDVLVGSISLALISSAWALSLSSRGIGTGLFHRPALYLMKISRLQLPSAG